MIDSDATGFDTAPQHGPRPLPLFLAMLRSEAAASPDLRDAAMRGLAAYQAADRPPPPSPRLIVARAGRVTLRDHGGDGPPVIVVPSLINPPTILDLAPATSLMRYIADTGHRALLVDWGTPDAGDRDQGLADHVEQSLVRFIAGCDVPPILIGYCLGGTLALAAAACTRVAGVATIAAPWRFCGYGDTTRAEIGALWNAARPGCEAIGVVPMEVLQTGFWHLDPARTIAKYAAFAAMEPGSAAAQAFVRLEDWANAGAPLPYAAGRDLFEVLIGADLPGGGAWQVSGHAIDPATLDCPAIEFVSTTDRIVPAATATGVLPRHDVAAGHVGMIVGRHAREQLWAPLTTWIARCV